MLVNVISGFSASLRSNEKTLSAFVDDAFGEIGIHSRVVKNVEYSYDSGCIDGSVEFLCGAPSDSVLLIGKSLGAVRTWWMLKSRWEAFTGTLSDGGRIGVVLIDPHGVQRGDGLMGAYGVRLKKLGFDPRWIRDDMMFRCIYQRSAYPRGACLDLPVAVDNAENLRLGSFADHWGVTDISTKEGKIVAGIVGDVVKWLEA